MKLLSTALKATTLQYVLLCLLALPASVAAQQVDAASTNDYGTTKKNFLKLNLTSLLLRNYALQYERVLSKTFSLAVAYRTMPSGSIPFKSAVVKELGDDIEARDAIERLRMSNVAFTPEVRMYLGKGYGKGFYIAPFYRYSKYTINNISFDYNNTAGAQSSIDMTGTFSSHTGGILFGAHWFLGKHLSLDWSILGPHYGKGNGLLSGVTRVPLTPAEQNDLRNELEDLEIPLTDKTVNVNANGASLGLDGPWGGIRAAISLGIRL